MTIEPIAVVRSCFGEKFAVPRQPGLCPDAWGRLIFEPKFRSEDAVRGLEGFSHVWLIFGFHATAEGGWRPTVRPPRLGGNERVGVFASRSTFRPNGLGLSLVALEGIDLTSEGPVLLLGGIDLIDGTPIYDVKPYLPYAESLPEAKGGYAVAAPAVLPVEISPVVQQKWDGLPVRSRQVIRQALAQDPRPAVQSGEEERLFGAALCGHNVRFQVKDGCCLVVDLVKRSGSGLID